MFRLLLSFLLLSVFSVSSHAISVRRSLDLSCQYVVPLQGRFINNHIKPLKNEREIEKRTIKNFIEKLDNAKVYLLKSDVKRIETLLKGIIAKTKNKNCKNIRMAQEIFKERAKSRIDFIKKYLKDPKFKLDRKMEFVFDSDDRKYPVTEQVARSFHQKYLHFQVASHVAADDTEAEAKAKVIRTYDRFLKEINSVTDKDLLTYYLDAFTASFDPHSDYISNDDLEEFRVSMGLSLEGIGASLSSQDGFTVIEQLIAGGPASRSGKLRPKDKIIAVKQIKKKPFSKKLVTTENVNVVDMKLRDVVKKIKGPKGTLVGLTILRKEDTGNKTFDLVLVRDKISLEESAAAIHYIDKEVKGKKQKIGLINLPSFYSDGRANGRSASKDMKRLIAEAKSKNVDGLVFDMSTNGGGSLDDAVTIAGLFFKTGNVVMQSQKGAGADSGDGRALADKDPAVDWAGPLVILISRISASASEIVAGTLKDYKRALIVGGDHTFGKGTVQQVAPLGGGLGALKTTISKFYVAGGKSTQHGGVESDIVFPSIYSTDDIGEKTLDYSLPPSEIKSFLSPDAYVYKGPNAWKPVKKSIITKLNSSSQKRIASSEDFKEIMENKEKAKKKGKLIKISEILEKDNEGDNEDGKSAKIGKDKKEKRPDEMSATERAKHKKEKYLERADVQEALNIMSDYIVAH